LAIDREATLRKAEKFLRVGRLDAAIAEYARVVEEQPRDWTTANALGDLHLRAGQPDKAVVLYQRIADHLLAEGFYPKAGALLKKILKIRPDDENALVHLGDIAARQGLVAEARGYYNTVATRRTSRGDTAGADELVARLGALDPADLDARLNGARALERRGELAAAATQYRELYDELLAKGRRDDAAATLMDMVRCRPEPVEPRLLLPLIAAELAAGEVERARVRLPELLRTHPEPREALRELANALLPDRVDAAALAIDAAVDHALASGDHANGAEILQQFTVRVPGHIPALLRLIEVGVDGDLDPVVHAAQAQLADAYLASGRAEEARVIAEDLVTRDRTDMAHVDRLRRALEMLDVPNVEAAMAERLNGPALDPLEFFEDEYTAPAPEGPVRESESDPVVAEILALGPTPAEPAPVPVAAPPEEPRPAPSSIPEIDLTSVLRELRAGAAVVPPDPVPPPELEDVFAGLRADAAAAPAEDESDDYLSLARTYLELSQRDEAISALLTAVKSPRNRFTCASMLARLYRDTGDIARAIEWYERGAEAPPPTPEDGPRLMYDLGDALETVGENARALAVFIEVDAEAPGFLDVAARIQRLSTDQVGG
jgi:tetratricopeptide (TPR) repeat protein